MTDLAIACHPRHATLYRRLYLFENLGAIKSYHAVNDAPASAVRLDLTDIKERYRAVFDGAEYNLYRFFFCDELFRHPDAALRAHAFDSEVCRELCELQPSVISAIEGKVPGLVKQLTGISPAILHSKAAEDSSSLWASPLFVAA